MSLSRKVTMLRVKYHSEVIEINNVLNQLHLISDEKAEDRIKKHTMIVFNDCFPRLGIDPFSTKK